MKRVTMLVVLACMALTGFGPVRADEEYGAPYKGSKAFERVKELVGVWEGTSNMGKESEKVTVKYKLTSGGSAIVETFFPGTPHEMVSVYYDKDGKLAMTHYCMLRNRPHMELTKADANDLDFTLAAGSDINVGKDTHMHALHITFVDKNHITQEWTGFENGRQKEVAIFKLSRVH
jgi:hypothetical protein